MKLERWSLLLLLGVNVACDRRAARGSHARSEAVASASQEMSGPSLFSSETLSPAVRALRSKAGEKWLRLEIRPHDITVQAEDPSTRGAVAEYRYRDGKVGEAERAVLRGDGELEDNLFDVAELRLDAIPALTEQALKRVDAEDGHVELVLVRRHLPETDDIRVRVYVHSPRASGHLDGDKSGRVLPVNH